jgi:transcriptional regulator with XRE-family HTH domain
MVDERFASTDGKAIRQLRKKHAWTQGDLADKAGVHLDTIKRAEQGTDRQPGTIQKIAKALEVEPVAILKEYRPDPVGAKTYTWDDLVAGAKKVAEEISKDDTLRSAAVLTFPGPSSIFCGLVLAALPLKTFIRMPVYTAIFVDANTPTSEREAYFHVIELRLFKILVPRELTADRKKKVLVIDDTILTGGSMERLREFFDEICDPSNVKFACCICHDSRSFLTEIPPEIIALRPLEQRRTFPLPWGDSFCFEDGFSTPNKD